jgi:hypothetical protein
MDSNTLINEQNRIKRLIDKIDALLVSPNSCFSGKLLGVYFIRYG